MKKLLALVLSLLMVAASFSACNKGSNVKKLSAETLYEDVAPLETPVDLVVGQVNGTQYGFINAMIEQLGGFEKAGITITDWKSYSNGPVMAVACEEWDIGTLDFSGILRGVEHNIKTVAAASRDCGSIVFVAQPTSDIVTTGITNTGGTTELYGDAASWKDTECAYPTDTTMQYVLKLALDKMGLTLNDIASIHMNVASVNSALRATQAEVGGLWGNYAYASDLFDKFVQVIEPLDVGCTLSACLSATQRCYQDVNKEKAIAKWIELYFRTVDYIYGNENGFSEAGSAWVKWNDDAGLTSTSDECLALIVREGNRHWTLKENYDMFNASVTVNDKVMNGVEQLTYLPLAFFHNNGSWDTITDDMFLSGLTDGSYAAEAYAAYQGSQKSTLNSDISEWFLHTEPEA